MLASRSAASNGADVTWPCFGGALFRYGSRRIGEGRITGRLALGANAHQDGPHAAGTGNVQWA